MLPTCAFDVTDTHSSSRCSPSISRSARTGGSSTRSPMAIRGRTRSVSRELRPSRADGHRRRTPDTVNVIRKIVDSIEKTGSVDHAFLDTKVSRSSRSIRTTSPATGSAPGRTSTSASRHPGRSSRSCRRRIGSATATNTRCPTSSCRARSASTTGPADATTAGPSVIAYVCSAWRVRLR